MASPPTGSSPEGAKVWRNKTTSCVSESLFISIWGFHTDDAASGTDWTIFCALSIGCHVKFDARASKF